MANLNVYLDLQLIILFSVLKTIPIFSILRVEDIKFLHRIQNACFHFFKVPLFLYFLFGKFLFIFPESEQNHKTSQNIPKGHIKVSIVYHWFAWQKFFFFVNLEARKTKKYQH